MGKPCDAVRPLEQWVTHHPDTPDARTTHRISRLNEACAATAPGGDPAALPMAGTGRVDLNGAVIRLPGGFVALPAGWSDTLDPATRLAADSKGFVRVNAKGDTIVIFRSIDVESATSLDLLASELEKLGRLAGGNVVRNQTKRGSRSVEVGLSFNRERNAAEWRGVAGHLEGYDRLVRKWIVQCEDRPAVASEDCQEIVRSLAIPDLGTLRLLSDVYATE